MGYWPDVGWKPGEVPLTSEERSELAAMEQEIAEAAIENARHTGHKQKGHKMSTNDPYEAASTATLAPRTYYGQIQIDAWFCVLIKGTGKVPYDSEQHRAEDRRTAIDISVIPLAEQNVSFEIKRETIAESREWAGIIWPSLKALGLASVKDANGAWAKMQQVPSGRKYRNSAGEEKEATTFKFLAIYPDAAACSAAYLSEVGGEPTDDNTPAPASNNEAGSNDHDLAVAVPFIKAFAKQAGYDLEKTKTMCATQAIITKAIDLESADFAQIVAGAMMGGQS